MYHRKDKMKYTITDCKPSIDKNTGSQYVDQYGNLSWNVIVKDESGQITQFLKRTKADRPAPKIDDVLEGTLTQEIGKSGTAYWKFTPEKKEFGGFKKDEKDIDAMLMRYALDGSISLLNHEYLSSKTEFWQEVQNSFKMLHDLHKEIKEGIDNN